MAFYIIYFVSVFLASCSQVLLKKSAQRTYESKLKEYLNPYVIGAYAVFGLTTVLTTIAYSRIPLAQGPVIETMGYIHIALLSFIFLHEKITWTKALGTACIIAGICVFTLL